MLLACRLDSLSPSGLLPALSWRFGTQSLIEMEWQGRIVNRFHGCGLQVRIGWDGGDIPTLVKPNRYGVWPQVNKIPS